MLGFTNALIRKELWDTYNFNEAYGAGGEDGDWANHWFQKGFYVIKDVNFAVFHSHYLGLLQWIAQFRHWRSLDKPQKFNYLEYRSDNAHKK